MMRPLLTPVVLAAESASSVMVASGPDGAGHALEPVPVVADGAGKARPPRPALPPPDLARGDPFRPFDEPAPVHAVRAAPVGNEPLKLFGTFKKGDKTVALVNGEFVCVGQRIGGHVVRRIDVATNTVTLERNGEETTLTEEGK